MWTKWWWWRIRNRQIWKGRMSHYNINTSSNNDQCHYINSHYFNSLDFNYHDFNYHSSFTMSGTRCVCRRNDVCSPDCPHIIVRLTARDGATVPRNLRVYVTNRHRLVCINSEKLTCGSQVKRRQNIFVISAKTFIKWKTNLDRKIKFKLCLALVVIFPYGKFPMVNYTMWWQGIFSLLGSLLTAWTSQPMSTEWTPWDVNAVKVTKTLLSCNDM